MSDLVVTVPKTFWMRWIAEGDAVGAPESGEEWGFFLNGAKPPIGEGDRLYIVAWGLLRGYAPVTRLARDPVAGWGICRRGGAVACTLPELIQGFRGFRHVWWKREQELPFPDWRTAAADPKTGRRWVMPHARELAR
jgi:hypothetical protein